MILYQTPVSLSHALQKGKAELKHVIPNMKKTFGHLEFAGEKNFESEERIKLINPKITAEGYKIGTRNYILSEDDMVKA